MEIIEKLTIIALIAYVTVSYLHTTAVTISALSYKCSTEEEVAKAFFIIVFAPISLPVLMFLKNKK